ncbi:MAG: heme exporter protein CcmD, partial [Mesorhizobium sp.]
MSAHALYVAAAYAISAIVLVGLIGWILIDRG